MGRGEAVQRWADSVADRLGVSIWGFVAGVAAIIAAAAGGWWALASPDVTPVEEMLPRVAAAPDAAAIVEASPAAEASGRIVVHVEGAVALPGVHELAAGSRVHDAIDAADGLTAEADRTRLNLAAQLADGQRVWVPAVGEPEPVVVNMDAAPGAVGSPGVPVNINTGDLATLETLPGIGPSIAAAIIRHRQEHGAFSRVEGLLEVPGIGPAKLDQILSLVTV